MDCIVHGVTKSQTRLSDFHFHSHFRLSSIILLFPILYYFHEFMMHYLLELIHLAYINDLAPTKPFGLARWYGGKESTC